MNTIYLYDMSAMVKSGTYSSTGKSWGKPRKDYNFYSFPTGGLYSFNERFLTDYLSSKPGDVFVACFDGHLKKYKRTQWYPQYKANRIIKGFDDVNTFDKKDPEQLKAFIDSLPKDTQEAVIRRDAAGIQLKLLRTILPKTGINVLYDEETEADDWIYTVCYLAGDKFKIMLRADDGDLDDCITYAPHLTKWSVSGRKELTPEPGKNFYKIFHGEAKDNIPNLMSRYGKHNLGAVKNAILSGLETSNILLDKEYLMNSYHLMEEEADDLMLNLKLVSPIFGTSLSLNDEPLNENQLITYFSSMRFKNALKRLHAEYIEGEEVTNLQKFAFSLLPEYVKEFYKRKEYVDPTVDATILNGVKCIKHNTEDYLLETAVKYNIL